MSPLTPSSCQDSNPKTSPSAPVEQTLPPAPAPTPQQRPAPTLPVRFECDHYQPPEARPATPEPTAPTSVQIETPRNPVNRSPLTPTESPAAPATKPTPDPRTFREILPDDAPVPVRDLTPASPIPKATPVSNPRCEPTPPACQETKDKPSTVKRIGQILLTFLQLTFELITLILTGVASIIPALIKGGVSLAGRFTSNPSPATAARSPLNRTTPLSHSRSGISSPAPTLTRTPVEKAHSIG